MDSNLRVNQEMKGRIATEMWKGARKSSSHTKGSSILSSKLAPEPWRKDEVVSPGWEHIVVKNGGLRIVSEHYSEEGSYSGGRGKLKVARATKVKACWTCWLLKVPVSAAISKTLWCGPTPQKFPYRLEEISPFSILRGTLGSTFSDCSLFPSNYTTT